MCVLVLVLLRNPEEWSGVLLSHFLPPSLEIESLSDLDLGWQSASSSHLPFSAFPHPHTAAVTSACVAMHSFDVGARGWKLCAWCLWWPEKDVCYSGTGITGL